MAIQDPNSIQEKNDGKKASGDLQKQHEAKDSSGEDKKGIGEVDVKNAHASGDGSYGRNDNDIPDEQADAKKADPPY